MVTFWWSLDGLGGRRERDASTPGSVQRKLVVMEVQLSLYTANNVLCKYVHEMRYEKRKQRYEAGVQQGAGQWPDALCTIRHFPNDWYRLRSLG